MSKSKSHKYDTYIDLNACIKGKYNSYGTMFESMCESKAFQNLSASAKNLYMLCRVQAHTNKGKSCLYKHKSENGFEYNHEKDFVFPASHLIRFGVDRSNARKIFNELIKAGFLTKREENNKIHKVNVYSFSDKWKDDS